MKKTMYILGGVEAILGVVLLWVANLIDTILPKLIHLGYYAVSVSSFSSSDYELNLTIPYIISGILILGGIAQIILSFRKQN